MIKERETGGRRRGLGLAGFRELGLGVYIYIII